VKQQQAWLQSRVDHLGFRLARSMADEPDLAIVERCTHRFVRDGSTITIATATYQGHLEVCDAGTLRRALTHGVGRAKAYGCGLLTLARPHAGTLR
jgi:CRISPR system Cascade subunit CasE